MPKPTIVVTDNYTPHFERARAVIERAGMEMLVAEQANPADPLAVIREADGLLVVWHPINDALVSTLRRCKVVVRCGIGYDNIDLAAARARGVAACNVPDYCVDEVAEHALSLSLALARRLPSLDRSLRDGQWASPTAIRAFSEMTLGVVGFGRIGRRVAEKATSLGFRLAAYDPFVADADFAAAGVTRLSLDAIFAEADIVTLHTPLMAETRHLANAERLARMKPDSILVNTSRGPLVDTVALAAALQNGTPSAAGLDVFETEPLPADHPLRACPNALLTPHAAWYSESSAARLYVMAAEEAVRGVRGEGLRSCLNK